MLVTLDFETYWDKDYSLSKMSAVEYVLDPRFEVISCAFALNDSEPGFAFGSEKVKVALADWPWHECMVLGHNMSGFDALILAYHYGVKPRLWLDTMCMAAEKHAKTCGCSLKALAAHYELGVKDQTALMNTKGKRAVDFTQQEKELMREYNMQDVVLTRALYHKLRVGFPREELWQIHATTCMVTEPAFVADVPRLEAALVDEKKRKQDALLALSVLLQRESLAELGELLKKGVDVALPVLLQKGYHPLADGATPEAATKRALGSAATLARLLTLRGVDPPMKVSPTTGLETYAFAKTDEAFTALAEHPDPLVAMAVQTRLDVQSSLLEKRLETLIRVARLCKGALPAPLKYCGADTTGRWSGADWNMQNLPRINPAVPALTDALRYSVCAPPGYKVVVADLAGIELRVNHCLWQVPGSMQAWQADNAGADLYKAFAARLFNKPESEVVKSERQVGKVAQLGLGYGAGAVTFKSVARTMGGITLTEEDAQNIVQTWRMAYPEIVRGWRTCGNLLSRLKMAHAIQVDPWRLVTTEFEALKLPSGRRIRYPNLQQQAGDRGLEWFYGGKKPVKIYGPKVVENIVQALARDILAYQALTLWQETGALPALLVHDEIVLVADESEAEAMLNKTLEIMRRPIPWWPELPLWAEGGIGDNYGSAKT